MQDHASRNPLLKWIESNDLTPYAQDSVLVSSTGYTHRYIGDIATDKRKCAHEVLIAIQEATQNQFTAAQMLEYWYGLPQVPVRVEQGEAERVQP